MLPIGDQPMLEILLEQCIANGFRTFYFSVNYLREQIIEHFGDGSRWGVSIHYLMESEPLGTAGSLQLLPSSLSEPFLVLNGDVLTRFDLSNLIRFHNEHKAHATLCVREHELTVPFGVVQTNGSELVGFEEKPTYRHQVNAGIYVIDPELLPLLQPHQFIDMPSFLFSAQEANHRVVVCPIHEYWLDVGRPESLQQAHREWTLNLNNESLSSDTCPGRFQGNTSQNIRPFCGKPLLQWSIDVALSASSVDRVVVSTDDPEIAEVALVSGAEVPFLRPPEFATDAASGIAPVLHALQQLPEVSSVLLLQPTSPLRLWRMWSR